MSDERKVRCFLALSCPGEWQRVFGELLHSLKEKLPLSCFKWVRAEQIHLTLRFFGGITASELAQIGHIANSIGRHFPSFDLDAAQLGCFPTIRKPRVLWLGLKESTSVLPDLHRAIAIQTASIGQPPENRPFKAHLTLARIKEVDRSGPQAIEQALRIPVPSFPRWHVKEFHILQSNLSPTGASYTDLQITPLALSTSATLEASPTCD